MRKLLTDPGRPGALRDLGLLVLRVAFSAAVIGAHGWGKLTRLIEGGGSGFPDPFGVGGVTSLALAVFAEVVCAILVVVGLGGRLPAAVLSVLFLVAFLMIHAADPFAERELAFVYLAAFSTLVLTGPGRYSLGTLVGRK